MTDNENDNMKKSGTESESEMIRRHKPKSKLNKGYMYNV